MQGELRQLALILLRIFVGAVFVEAIGAQARTDRKADCQLLRGRLESAHGLDRDARFAYPQRPQLDGEAAACGFQIVATCLLGLAQAQHQQPVQLEAGRIAQLDQLAALELAAPLRDGAAQGAA